LEPSARDSAAPLFPAWSNTALRVALALIFLLAISVPAALWAGQRTPYVSGELDPKMQPIEFDHRHHVRDCGIPCGYCHADFRRASSAGMPASSVCMGCHAQIWSDSPRLAPLRASYFEDAPLAWERVTRLPDFVFFDHASHVTKGVGCVTCHGRVDLMASVYAVEPFTMNFCLDCHRAPERFLRPLEAVTDMEWTPAKAGRVSARERRQRDQARPGTDCTVCHR
jgi:hypothetical protein